VLNKSEIKTVYAYTSDGKYMFSVMLDYTDRSPISGDWQLPAGTTEIAPPEKKDGYDLCFNEGVWQYTEQVKEATSTEIESTITVQNYVAVDDNLLNIAQAIANQEERLARLEGSTIK
jgi:hypothetical protein